ncbi:hypothetical protein BGX21_002377 [Mortierella sp. AD011]|nr:hypothetical protein BGX21_002377 [Mortierella sp. AD011]
MTGADIKALKIRYIGVEDISLVFPKAIDIGPYKYLHLRGIDAEGLLSLDLKNDIRFDIREKGLILKLRRIMETRGTAIGTEDSKTSDLVADLLTGMGWNTFPFSVSRDPAYKFDIGLGNEVISVPGYVVEKDGPVLIVNEDKRIKNANRIWQWGEYRLTAEMIVCGLAGNRLEGDIPLHGMRVIGTQFTFYHTIIAEKYYLNLGSRKEKMENKKISDIRRQRDSRE